ncbi:MAG: hypothetical protein L6Q98_13500 [Anaerolineae bacterium]|nr:hypothetical protein [Anaerolineae bacterium]NUQ03396.1 hypothetical protein [Anaerolineae bacterium]
MDIILVVLRLLHIVFSFLWFGLGITATLYILPAAVSSGASGMRFARNLLTRTPFGRMMPIVSGVTTLAGLLLYLVGSPSHFSLLGNIVLGIGAVAGLAATVHGGAMTGRATREFAMALATTVPEGDAAIPANALSNLNALAAKLMEHQRISTILMVIALLGMGLARYL